LDFHETFSQVAQLLLVTVSTSVILSEKGDLVDASNSFVHGDIEGIFTCVSPSASKQVEVTKFVELRSQFMDIFKHHKTGF